MGIKQRTVVEGDRVYNVWDQPATERQAVLDGNTRVRNDRTARRLDWGQPHLRIPELDLELLKQRNPDLASADGQVRRKAWIAFYNSAEALPYRVRPKAGGATNRSYLGGRQ